MTYFLLLVGFVLLVIGADFFVRGSSKIAKLLRVPSVVIGLTIVAMGTSAPECSVSITAALSGNNDIALGNITGSNLFNLLFIVGACALIRVSAADKIIIRRDLPLSLGAAILVLFFAIDGQMVLWEGILSILIFVAYLTLVVIFAVRGMKQAKALEQGVALASNASLLRVVAPAERAPLVFSDAMPEVDGAPTVLTSASSSTAAKPINRSWPTWVLNFLFMGGGLTAVIFGGQMVVNNAVMIAQDLGLSESLIGLTIVAIGTSLPELVTSIVAAIKRDAGLALGNVIGSNIFNLLFILGLSATMHTISIDLNAIIDTAILSVATLGFVIWYFCGGKTNRGLGVVSVLGYVGYMVYICLR